MSKHTIPYDVVCKSSDRKRWLEERRNLIGASDSLNRKTLDDKLGKGKDYTNKWAFNGSLLEPAIIRIFSLWTGMRCRPHGALLRSKKYPYMGATLDGLCRMPQTERGKDKMLRYLTMDLGLESDIAHRMIQDTTLAGLEIKAPVYRKLSEWGQTATKNYYKTGKPYEDFANKLADSPPADYYTQVQHQMIVTGLKVVWLVALVGGEHTIAHRITANPEAQRRRLKLCETFWNKVELSR